MRFGSFALSLLVLAASSGCTTAPRVVIASGPSLDNGNANSGILSILPDKQYLVTPLFNERYAALVKMYGAKLIPPMSSPRWISPEPNGTNFILTANGLAAFAELDFYARQHLSP